MKSLVLALLLANTSNAKRLETSKSQDKALAQVEAGSQNFVSDIFGKDFDIFGSKEESEKSLAQGDDEIPDSEAATIVDVVTEKLPEPDEGNEKKEKSAAA